MTNKLMQYENHSGDEIVTMQPIPMGQGKTVIYKPARYEFHILRFIIPAFIASPIGCGMAVLATENAGIPALFIVALPLFGVLAMSSKTDDLLLSNGNKVKMPRWSGRKKDAIIFASDEQNVFITGSGKTPINEITSARHNLEIANKSRLSSPNFSYKETLFRKNGKYYIAQEFTEKPLQLWAKTLSSAIQLEQAQGKLQNYITDGTRLAPNTRPPARGRQYYPTTKN